MGDQLPPPADRARRLRTGYAGFDSLWGLQHLDPAPRQPEPEGHTAGGRRRGKQR